MNAHHQKVIDKGWMIFSVNGAWQRAADSRGVRDWMMRPATACCTSAYAYTKVSDLRKHSIIKVGWIWQIQEQSMIATEA
jgi:hypothetical protein